MMTTRLVQIFTVIFLSLVHAQMPPEKITGRWNLAELAAPANNLVWTTPAQLATVNATLKSVQTIVNSSSALNPPMGIELKCYGELREWLATEGIAHPAGAPIPFRLEMNFFRLFQDCPACPVERAGEASGWVGVLVNDIAVLLEPFSKDSTGWKMWLAPRRIGTEHGFPVYESRGGSVALTKITEPMWLPVSQQDFLKFRIEEMKRELSQAKRVQTRAPGEQESTMAEMRQAVRDLARIDPKAAQEMQKTLDETARQLRENAPAQSQEWEEGLAKSRQIVRALEAELAGLTAPQRLAPAYFTNARADLETVEEEERVNRLQIREQGRLSGLVDNGEASGRMVVTINPNFFNRHLPRTAVQLLVVKNSKTDDLVVEALRKRAYATVNWPALFELVQP